MLFLNVFMGLYLLGLVVYGFCHLVSESLDNWYRPLLNFSFESLEYSKAFGSNVKITSEAK